MNAIGEKSARSYPGVMEVSTPVNAAAEAFLNILDPG